MVRKQVIIVNDSTEGVLKPAKRRKDFDKKVKKYTKM